MDWIGSDLVSFGSLVSYDGGRIDANSLGLVCGGEKGGGRIDAESLGLVCVGGEKGGGRITGRFDLRPDKTQKLN